jgi:hypothetical protein
MQQGKRKRPSRPKLPSKDQLQRALETARHVLTDPEADWYPANTFKLNDEFEKLQLNTYAAQTEALLRAAREVTAEDYEPPEPPGTSDEPVCRGTQMLPFVWNSESFRKLMFFKFGIHKAGHLYIFSLHPADFIKKTRKK